MASRKTGVALTRLTDRIEDWGSESALERRRSALKWAVARLAYRAFPLLSSAVLEIEAAGLNSPAIPQLFSRNLREIDPSLNNDLLDLHGRSERALANQFTFFHRTEQFDEEIDWERHESPAWRSEFHAFDYALDLALTYRISREERYARHLRYLIAHWVASNPPLQGTGWLLRPLARRVRNWILAADLARDDWERDPMFSRVVGESLSLQSTYLFRHAGYNPHGAHCLDDVLALELAGKFFAGSKGSEFRSAARRTLFEKLETQAGRCGDYLEPRPLAQLRLGAAVMEWLLFDAGSKGANSVKETLRQILTVLEGVLHADGTLPLFGASAQSPGDLLTDLFALAAVCFEEPRWKSLAGQFGIVPYMLLGEEGKCCFDRLPHVPWEPDHNLLPASGLYRLCGSASSSLVINGRLPSSPRDHQDFLSYELIIGGHRVVVDSGAFAPEGQSWNEYFASARAHNVLLVDGQAARAVPSDFVRPLPENRQSSPGVVELRLRSRGFEFEGVNHQRAWFCLEGGGWIVLDRLEGSGSRRSTHLLHFFPTFHVQPGDERATVRSRALAVTVIPLGQPRAKMTVAQGYHPEFPGWYAPDLGIKYPASVLALEWTSLRMPWIGGAIIIPGEEVSIRAVDTNAVTGQIEFELSGKQFRLWMES